MRSRGLNSEKTKKANRLGVLKLICTNPDISRTAIAKKMGLTKMTVSIIVNGLIVSGSVVETENKNITKKSRSNKRGAGRKQTGLKLSEKSPLVIGIFISRVKCEGVLTALDMTPIYKKEKMLSANETCESLLEKTFSLINDLLKQAENDCREVSAIGVASLGPLNAQTGVILNPPNFFSIENLEIVKSIEEKFKITTFLHNDMDGGAIAEMHFGRCKDISNFVYVGCSHGIGAGIISDSELYGGASGFAGEIGHVSINFEGPLCHCGNRGCLETYISIDNLRNEVWDNYKIQIESFKDFWELEDKVKDENHIVIKACDLIVTSLINLCNTLDPKVIIFGHEAVYFTDKQIEYIEKKVNKGVLSKGVSEIKIFRSAFYDLSSVYGAASIAIDKVFKGDICYNDLFKE